MLKNYKLLLDNDCPMCKVYGQLFVKLNLIDASVLTSFQYEAYNNNVHIDHERAKNEIAFYNTKTEETVYGLDAIIKIVSQNFSLLEKFLHLKVVHKLLKFIYLFISYNRKQIIPVRTTVECHDCTPEFNMAYRWTYILFVAMTTAIILTAFFKPIFQTLGVETFVLTEYVICFGQILWQATVIGFLSKEDFMDYLGNMSTVSILGGLLLLPIIAFSSLLQISLLFKLFYFVLVVTVMVVEHLRRCFLLNIPHLMTASWILYRVIIFGVLVTVYFFS